MAKSILDALKRLFKKTQNSHAIMRLLIFIIGACFVNYRKLTDSLIMLLNYCRYFSCIKSNLNRRILN